MSRTDLPFSFSRDTARCFPIRPGGHRKKGAETLGSEGGRKMNRTIYEILSSFVGPREEIEKFFYVGISLSLSFSRDWFGRRCASSLKFFTMIEFIIALSPYRCSHPNLACALCHSASSCALSRQLYDLRKKSLSLFLSATNFNVRNN